MVHESTSASHRMSHRPVSQVTVQSELFRHRTSQPPLEPSHSMSQVSPASQTQSELLPGSSVQTVFLMSASGTSSPSSGASSFEVSRFGGTSRLVSRGVVSSASPSPSFCVSVEPPVEPSVPVPLVSPEAVSRFGSQGGAGQSPESLGLSGSDSVSTQYPLRQIYPSRFSPSASHLDPSRPLRNEHAPCVANANRPAVKTKTNVDWYLRVRCRTSTSRSVVKNRSRFPSRQVCSDASRLGALDARTADTGRTILSSLRSGPESRTHHTRRVGFFRTRRKRDVGCLFLPPT